MSALVCDICGGKLKVINGKIAVCESCGIEHSIEHVRQKYQEAQNVVHVDNAHLISNYYSMAQDAYGADNKEEAERYCNKIIEIDSTNADALCLKGKAVGWQSKIGSLRFKEAVLCFANAVMSEATESEKKERHYQVQNELNGMATALIKLRCERFQKWPDGEESSGFENDLNEISGAISMYVQKTAMVINKDYVFGNVASIVRLCMTMVSLTIRIEYLSNGSRHAYSEFVSKTDRCINIMKKTIDLCDDDDASDIQLYEQSIEMLNNVISLNSFDQTQNRWGAYVSTPRLADSDLKRKKQKINEFELKISKLRTN